MKKKKKIEKIYHVLDDDCKMCVRRVMARSPLMQDLHDAKGYSLVSIKGSLSYLLSMTEIIETGIGEAFGEMSDEEQKVVFADYFRDIKTILELFKRMKDGVDSADRTTTI